MEVVRIKVKLPNHKEVIFVTAKRFSTSSDELQERLIADMQRQANERIKQTKTLLGLLSVHLDAYAQARESVPEIIDHLVSLGSISKAEVIVAFDIPKELTTRPRKKKVENESGIL